MCNIVFIRFRLYRPVTFPAIAVLGKKSLEQGSLYKQVLFVVSIGHVCLR